MKVSTLMLGAAVVLIVGALIHAYGPAAQRRQVMSTTRPAGAGGAIYSKSGYDITPYSEARVEELAKGLTPEERHILLDKGTERAFCGLLLKNKEPGVYTCRLCSLPLFSSESKFESRTGWPSFFQPFDPAHIREQRDTSQGMVRVETLCARCGAHLGHVFNDGPQPTGLRYCMNSGSLKFHTKGAPLPAESQPSLATAYFAGGCFWGVEGALQQVPGVVDVTSGYQGGSAPNPTYKLVCTGATGHAESVRVLYDPKKVTYRQLLQSFFEIHDPTQLNRQGPDYGAQYRSAIFAANDEQLREAKAYIEELSKSPAYRGRKIVTQVQPAAPFYEAEDYHQNYHAKHGGACAVPSLATQSAGIPLTK